MCHNETYPGSLTWLGSYILCVWQCIVRFGATSYLDCLDLLNPVFFYLFVRGESGGESLTSSLTERSYNRLDVHVYKIPILK